jgi:pimeloyl-ACP methyl ester carboxylesterase
MRTSKTNAVLGGIVAGALGVAAWAATSARRAERASPPVGRFLTVDGVRLHYIDEGEGPVVVLLHGNLVTLQDFAASGMIGRLTQRHRVIAFDRPGFGYSERPRHRVWTPQAQAALFQRALAHLGVADAVVVGQSFGALVAVAMALDARIDIRGLTLISGYYYPSARADAAMTAPAAWPLIGDLLRYTVSSLAARMMYAATLRAMFSPWDAPATFHALLPREFLLRPSQMRAAAEDAASMIPAAAALSARYGEIDLPVRIFAGRDDKIVGADAQSGRLYKNIAPSVLSVLQNAGHMLHYDDEGRVADAIEAMSVAVE